MVKVIGKGMAQSKQIVTENFPAWNSTFKSIKTLNKSSSKLQAF